MIRGLVIFGFWGLCIPFAALVGFPVTFITRRIDFLYGLAMRIARAGIRLAGVQVEIVGRDALDLSRNYIFMANHASNIDPPLLLPILPRRTSVLVKKELFRVPLLGQAMKMARLVAIDRSNKEAAIASVRRAGQVLGSGLDMTVFPEGTRSRDGRLLPFKKGPFHMAMETGIAVVPVTIAGTHDILPKGTLRLRPGVARVTFHAPLLPFDFADREQLMAAVEQRVASALPVESQ